MTERVQVGGIQVAKNLYDFVNNEAIPGTGIDADKFWAEFDKIVNELAPRNRELLAKRDAIQEKMDSWNRDHKGQKLDMAEYKSFLKDIGYLVDEPSEFKISTSNVDPEVATMAGPQLVVPIMNARFALNAANARWGSLYDALYGTDAISEEDGAEKGKGYNPVRGAKVI
jgi:malate synthase